MELRKINQMLGMFQELLFSHHQSHEATTNAIASRLPALIFEAPKEGNTISYQIPRRAEITTLFVKAGLMK